jgi:hypothetical protein
MPARLAGVFCVVLLAIAIGLQARMGSIALPLSLTESDEPAHFTTGVMAHEYLRSALLSNPLAFAESFYVRFPKVAMGQWPPVYYGVQAAWYFLFPTSSASSRVLSALIAATLAAVLFMRLRPGYGFLPAGAAAAILLSLPAIQTAAWEVMSDLLTGVFVLLAILSFSTFLEEPRRTRHVWWFAAWSSLAVLTKGSALALLPFALLAPLLTRRPRCFGNIWYWASGIACGLMSAPFYIVTARLGIGYPVHGLQGQLVAQAGARAAAQATVQPRPWLPGLRSVPLLLSTAPALVWILAGIGLAAVIASRWRDRNGGAPATDALAAGCWLLAQTVSLVLFPMTKEARVYIPALAPTAILVAHALAQAPRILRSRPVAAVFTQAGLALLCIFCCGTATVTGMDGYRAAAASIPYRPEGSLILVSSNYRGEGAIVSERLAHDPGRAGIILRSSRFLAVSSWSGLHYHVLLNDAADIREYLTELPVHYVLLDDTTPLRQEQQLIEEAIRIDPQDFVLLGRYPIREYGGRYLGDVRVFENRSAGDRRPAVVRVHLDAERGERVLEYRWH